MHLYPIFLIPIFLIPIFFIPIFLIPIFLIPIFFIPIFLIHCWRKVENIQRKNYQQKKVCIRYSKKRSNSQLLYYSKTKVKKDNQEQHLQKRL